MTNKNQITVKQPELGQKILELRKAKGLTQEELVDRCNINVRTIQRIEAGEVTPRMFTVKTILEALGYDLDAVQFRETDEETSSASPQGPSPALKSTLIMGITYFILSFVETFFDLEIWGAYPPTSFQEVIPFSAYLLLKIIIVLTFGGFMLGFYRVASWKSNTVVKITAIILAGLTLVYEAIDSYSYYVGKSHVSFLIVEAISFGIVYILFSIGLMKYRRTFGDLAYYTGILGVVTGFFFMTVILAIPGLILLTVFEILCLALLYRAIERSSQKEIVSPEVTSVS